MTQKKTEACSMVPAATRLIILRGSRDLSLASNCNYQINPNRIYSTNDWKEVDGGKSHVSNSNWSKELQMDQFFKETEEGDGMYNVCSCHLINNTEGIRDMSLASNCHWSIKS